MLRRLGCLFQCVLQEVGSITRVPGGNARLLVLRRETTQLLRRGLSAAARRGNARGGGALLRAQGKDERAVPGSVFSLDYEAVPLADVHLTIHGRPTMASYWIWSLSSFSCAGPALAVMLEGADLLNRLARAGECWGVRAFSFS